MIFFPVCKSIRYHLSLSPPPPPRFISFFLALKKKKKIKIKKIKGEVKKVSVWNLFSISSESPRHE